MAEAPAPSPLRLAARPNPFNPSTTLSFDLPGEGAAELRIFTVDGRQVWGRILRAEQRSVTWNGRDAAGRRLASGLYLAHLKQGDQVAAIDARDLVVFEAAVERTRTAVEEEGAHYLWELSLVEQFHLRAAPPLRSVPIQHRQSFCPADCKS